MVTTRQAGLEIAEDSVDPPELGSLLWFVSGDNCKMVTTANFGDGPKAGQGIGEYRAAGCQTILCPG